MWVDQCGGVHGLIPPRGSGRCYCRVGLSVMVDFGMI